MTKMSFLRDNGSFIGRRTWFVRHRRAVIGLTCVVLVIFMILLTREAFLSSAAQSAGATAWSLRDFVSEQVSGFFSVWKSKIDLIEDNARLTRILRNNEIAMLQDKLLRDENERLRSLLGDQTNGSSTILASVVVRPPESFYDTLIVSAGADRGTRVGSRVYAEAGVLIGTVGEVFPRASKVILYSNPGDKWNAVLETNTTSVVAKGTGLGNFVIEMPRETEVSEGDALMLADRQELLGYVGSISMNDSDSFKRVYARTPFNLRELSWVKIEK